MQTLKSERLRLRQWTADDAPFVLDMCSRWEVQRNIGAHPRVLQNLGEASNLIARWDSHQDDLHRVWAVEHRDGHLLGTLLLVAISASGTPPLQPTGETEVGWYFHPDAWGQGYAHEAATLGLDYASASGLTEVLAVTHPDNAPSQVLCHRLDMNHLGRTERYYNMTCELFSTSRSGLTGQAEWNARSSRAQCTSEDIPGTMS